MKLLNSLAGAVLLCVMGLAWAANETSPAGGALAGERLRLIISSDIGGSDNDDFQSMIHFLMYADLFDTEGLISSPPDQGRAIHFMQAIDAYAADFPNLKAHSQGFPEPASLRAVVKQGAIDPSPAEGHSQPTEGSNWLIERARAADPRPLYVIVWGSITDVAQAVHDAPEIKSKIRVYFISSWNRAKDKAARNYLYEQHPDLWMIESDTTFRGMYVGGNQTGDLENRAFLDSHVRGHGALGAMLVEKLPAIKMGDTPSLLYLMRGNPGQPEEDHWGGRYVSTGHGPHYWTDIQDTALKEGRYPGAKTVNSWREAFLRDWQSRMDWLTRVE